MNLSVLNLIHESFFGSAKFIRHRSAFLVCSSDWLKSGKMQLLIGGILDQNYDHTKKVKNERI